MNESIKQKRIVRGYKIAHNPYIKARVRANGMLATLVESWVTAYGDGASILIMPPKSKPKSGKK